MTEYTQKKQYAQNATEMLKFKVHTGLRAGISEDEWNKILECVKNGGEPLDCSLPFMNSN